MALKKVWLLQNTEDPNIFGLGSMDIAYDSGGRVSELDGAEKLRLLLVKCVLTGRYIEQGISYGSTIPRLLGTKMRGANEFTDGLFLMAVDRALENYRIGQPSGLDPSETMSRINEEIQVSRDQKDQTILLVGASVRNGDGTVISVIHSFKTV